MADKLSGWTLVKEGRAKLLLAESPVGVHLETELATRVAMWVKGEFDALLTRIEAQPTLRAAAGKTNRNGALGKRRRGRSVS